MMCYEFFASILMIYVCIVTKAWSTIESVISGKDVDGYKYSPRSYDKIINYKKFIAHEVKRMKKKRSSTYFKELIGALVKKGLLTEEIKQSKNRYKVSFLHLSECTSSEFSYILLFSVDLSHLQISRVENIDRILHGKANFVACATVRP